MRWSCRVLWIALVVASAACRADFAVDPPVARVTPLAHAGTGSRVLVGTTVEVDGRSSFDPDGQVSSFAWTLATKPMTSKAMLADASAPMTSLVLDAVGGYDVQLRVTDNDGLVDTSWVQLVAEGPRITVNAGADAARLWRTSVQLAGSYEVEAGFPATVSWTFASQPAGSTATITNATTLTPSFVPDAEGTFIVRMIVQTAHGTAHDDVVITANVPRQLLGYELLDVEYSTALDRHIIVSTNPSRLHIHDPATNTEQVVNLTRVPRSVSLSPDGLRAAVAHLNYVTVVNLQTLGQSEYQVNFSTTDVIFGANNQVHCISETVPDYIRTLDLATRTLTNNTGSVTYNNTHGRLHPSGTKLYTVDSFFMRRYDVTTSSLAWVRNFPQSPDTNLGTELWYTPDGGRIITRDGKVYLASDDAATDMTVIGSLNAHRWVTSSAALGTIATGTYPSSSVDGNGHVRTFNASTLAYVKTTAIPPTPYNGMFFPSDPWHLAYRSDSSVIYAIAHAGHAGWVLYEVEP